MAAAAKVLIAEDDLVAARLLDTIVRKGGYETAVARSGAEALCRDDLHSFDAVVTDWMMPEVDGIQLIRELRRRVDPAPLVVMVTAIALPEARDYALKAGADEFVQKPFEPKEIVSALHSGLARRAQPDPKPLARRSPRLQTLPPFVGLAIAASTGGPMALTHLFAELPPSVWVHASVFVVLHGPDWMLTSFVDRLERAGGRPVRLGEQGTRAEPGHAYLAPGDQHLAVRPGPPTITVTKGPLENFIRPAADPLLRSMAATFGPYGVAVVLTGMGKEGAKGAAHVAAAGGAVLVQDPKSAAAPSMPGTVVNEGLATEIGDLTALAGALGRRIPALSRKLQAASVS